MRTVHGTLSARTAASLALEGPYFGMACLPSSTSVSIENQQVTIAVTQAESRTHNRHTEHRQNMCWRSAIPRRLLLKFLTVLNYFLFSDWIKLTLLTCFCPLELLSVLTMYLEILVFA